MMTVTIFLSNNSIHSRFVRVLPSCEYSGHRSHALSLKKHLLKMNFGRCFFYRINRESRFVLPSPGPFFAAIPKN